jgi:hypothetical protein
MKRTSLLIAVFLFCVVTVVMAGVVIHSMKLAIENGFITLEWTTGQEDNLDGFLLERCVNNTGQYLPILENKILPQGVGTTYRYQDQSALKTTAARYQYRLVVLGKDGSQSIQYFQGSASPGNGAISGVKRTWGSIKAMFR